jgi:hypothetical protein
LDEHANILGVHGNIPEIRANNFGIAPVKLARARLFF